MRLTVSEVAEGHLERWLDGLMRGELALHRLPAPVAAYYYVGWNDRDAIAKAEAAEYERQIDRLYLAAFSPKDRREILQRRLDRHFAEQDRMFFAEPRIEGPTLPTLESQLHIAATERRAA